MCTAVLGLWQSRCAENQRGPIPVGGSSNQRLAKYCFLGRQCQEKKVSLIVKKKERCQRVPDANLLAAPSSCELRLSPLWREGPTSVGCIAQSGAITCVGFSSK